MIRSDLNSWTAQASCRGTDPDLFFPRRGDRSSVRKAKAICADCPVRARCLWARMSDETYGGGSNDDVGVWGGTAGSDRRKIRHERGLWLLAKARAELEAAEAAG